MEGEEKVTYLAQTDARGKKVSFGIKAKDRSRHVYVIGKTGMGKSTLLENMAIQDLKSGEGLAFVDPHGKSAELLLDYVPEERAKDVVYFAPFDLDHPISFNVMEDVGYDKRHLVVSGLMSAFKKIWVDAWSGRMEYILSNTLLALLEYPEATLLGVNRMLIDKEYRKKVVANVTDPIVKSFWVDEFARYTDRYTQEATPAIQNKVGQFTSNPLIRNIVGQPKSSFDLREIMDKRKIFIVNLSKGKMGEINANLLGSMLITKIYLAAMSRADTAEEVLQTLPHFYLYVDEFQSFANESFSDILSEARKYKLNLTLAHQYIEQMSEEVRAAVFGNVGTMIVFRVGAYDAEVLEKEFAPQFSIEDLVNLGFVQIYLKLMIDGVTSSPFSATTLPPIKKPLRSFKREIIEHSRSVYAKPRSVIEEKIRVWHEPVKEEKKEKRGESVINRENKESRGASRFQELEEEKKIKNHLLSEPETASPKATLPAPKKKSHAKGPSEESRRGLREALSSIIGEVSPEESKKNKEEKVKQIENFEKVEQENRVKLKNPKEVPEEVLRKILDV
jgi:energy-coupling factor transporter ATP-binding protein EcfA2